MKEYKSILTTMKKDSALSGARSYGFYQSLGA